jgi:peptide/nickel transport system permease protein
MTIAPSVLQVGSDETAVPPDGGAAIRGRRIFDSVRKKPAVVLSVGFIALIVLLALVAPLLTVVSGHGPLEFDPAAINPDLGGAPVARLGGIGGRHWFGVEPQSGRDIFARIVYGARVSLAIAFAGTVLTTLLGVVLGLVGGFYGGSVDQLISRVMDFLMAFPALIFMIALLSSLPPGNRPVLLVVVLSFFGWPYVARVIRGQTITLANREFVEAARSSGASRSAIVFGEILPNLKGTIIVMATLAVPGYIGTEAGLSFLGVGVTPPTPSWGQMISSSVGWYAVDPMYFLIPGTFLFLTVLSFTVFGDHLRQALDAGNAA